MKSILTTALAALFILSSLSSCHKCYHCVNPAVTNDAGFDICDKGPGYNGGTGTSKLAVDDMQRNGYQCTAK